MWTSRKFVTGYFWARRSPIFVSHQLISYGRFKINTVCSVDKVVWAPFLLPNFQNYCNKFIEVHSNEMNVKWNYLILSICSYCLNFKYFISVYVHLLSLYCSCCCCILCRLHVCRNVAIYVFGIFVFVFIFKYLFCTKHPSIPFIYIYTCMLLNICLICCYRCDPPLHWWNLNEMKISIYCEHRYCGIVV